MHSGGLGLVIIAPCLHLKDQVQNFKELNNELKIQWHR